MTFQEYQKQALSFLNPEIKQKQLLNLAALGLNGEAGQVADYWKKVKYHNHKMDNDTMIKQLGDVLWYIALLCDALDTNISDVMEKNIIKLKTRYPNGKFESERSRNRTDES